MISEKITTLAATIMDHSLDIQSGERILIEGTLGSKPLILALIQAAEQRGAMPFVRITDEEIQRALLQNSNEDRVSMSIKWDMEMFKDVDANVFIAEYENDAEFSGIDSETMQMRSRVRKPLIDMIIGTKKWVLLNWPTKGLAQKSRMAYQPFYDFVIDSCILDYSALAKAMQPLSELMRKTDKVHIKGEGTDLTFSIKGIDNEICSGLRNLPDGEIYTAPVRDSVNGMITYNTPCPYHGQVYHGVSLTFKDGKVIKATADDNTDKLNAIFDTDEGARYVGEFALGVNPMITRPFGNILFDEKIMGSFHFTPGSAYEDTADNGNRSGIHWDMVCIQTPEYGGGEIWFDDVLIRKDGDFVLPELQALNAKK